MCSVHNKYKKIISSLSVSWIFRMCKEQERDRVFVVFFIKKENYQIYCPKEILQQTNKYNLVFLLKTNACILFLW